MTQDAFTHLRPVEVAGTAQERGVESGPAASWFRGSSLAGKAAPPRLWHVSDIIPGANITLLGGDGGTGKSLLALQLAVATASGSSWLGWPVTSGGAMYISAEDDGDELHRRLEAICGAEQIDLAELDRLMLLSLAGSSAVMATPQPRGNLLATTPLFADIEAQIVKESPTLVVFDTLSDLWSGDENNRTQARQFVGLLRGLAFRHGCTVLLLAHPSLTGLSSGSGLSGSTAWGNSVRSRLLLEYIDQDGYEADPDRRKLTVKKANYGERGREYTMRFDGGLFLPEGGETALDRKAIGARAERVFLELLRLHAEQGRKVSAAGGPNYAPKVFEAHPDAEGVTSRAFKVAMERLLSAKQLQVSEYGPPSKRRSCIEEVAK